MGYRPPKRTKRILEVLRQHGIYCGAKSKSTGKECRKPPYNPLGPGNGRCYWHGGKTGPRSPDGERRRVAGFEEWLRKRREGAQTNPKEQASP